MIYGVDNVSSWIEDQHYCNLKVFSSRPSNKDAQEPCVFIKGANSSIELAESFKREMSYRAPGQQYWIKLYGDKNESPIAESFSLEGNLQNANSPVYIGSNQSELPSNLIELTAENARLKIELENTIYQLEDAKKEIVDLEELLDAEEENSSDPLTQSLVSILGSLAQNTSNGSLSGNSEVLSAFLSIKNVEPKAEDLIIKLGKLATTEPDKLKGFINTLNSSL
jgi:hypothetical protein